MTSNITAAVDVSRPIQPVYNQWTQFESFPQFMEGVEHIKQLDDTHLHWTIKVGRSTREFDTIITEQHPEERVAWKSDAGPSHGGVVTFHKIDDNTTRVTTQMDIDPDGVVENVADKLNILDRRVHQDLKRFKEFIESQPAETGA
jgi:uncharacterized membrane protein